MIDIRSIIERDIFRKLVDVIVLEGYGVDPNDPSFQIVGTTGIDNKRAAMDIITANKGFCIEVFGVGTSQNRGVKKTPRISIDSVSFQEGNVAQPPHYYSMSNKGSFDLIVDGTISMELNINIVMEASNAEQDRVTQALVWQALPPRTSLTIDSMFSHLYKGDYFIMFQSSQVWNNTLEGINGKVHSYKVPDLYVSPTTTVITGIPPINEITIELPPLDNLVITP